MGAGGAAPPVKGEDVMILIGSSIILIMFIMQAWVDPTIIKEEDGGMFIIKYDLSEGDTFTLEVLEGTVRPAVTSPSEELEQYDDVKSNWEFTAKEDGVHVFMFSVEEESQIEYSVTRGIIFDFLPYLIGGVILAFGLWKRIALSKDEPIEAVLED